MFILVSGDCSLLTPLSLIRVLDSSVHNPNPTLRDMRRTRASLLLFCLVRGAMIFLTRVVVVQRHRWVILNILCGMRRNSVLANRVGKTVPELSL
jgi:hypothetical protein